MLGHKSEDSAQQDDQRGASDAQAAPPAAAATAAAAAAATAADPAGLLRRISAEGARRTAGQLKELVTACAGIQGLVGLHGGLVPERLFPVAALTAATPDGARVQLAPQALGVAQQQYSLGTSGFPPLLRWVEAHTAELHRPPAGHTCMITDGSTHGLEMVCSLFLDPGDSVIVEEFTYPQALECNLIPRGCRLLPVPLDHGGILPDELGQLLEGLRQRGEQMPKFLYTVPTGQNPTGATAGLERKRAVYELCRRYGLIIVEDDAYFYLQFPAGPQQPPGLAGLPHGASYLSLDADGRVIRLDTFSKFLSPGLRLGWATAAPGVTDKMVQALQAQSLGASGLCQALVAQLLEAWGRRGLEAHLAEVQASYAAQCGALAAAAERELAGLAEWRVPQAGMFLWARLLGVEEASDLLPSLMQAAVIVVPGRICTPRGADPGFRCPWVRISFSHLPPERLEEGMRRLGDVLRAAQQQRQQQGAAAAAAAAATAVEAGGAAA